jgi:hypothetical protein
MCRRVLIGHKRALRRTNGGQPAKWKDFGDAAPYAGEQSVGNGQARMGGGRVRS